MNATIRTLLLFPLAFAAACASAGGGSRPLPPSAQVGAPTVRAGDQVALRIFGEPLMSDTFTVAFDGRVTLPRLGAVRAAGRTVPDLQDSLRVSLATFLRNPSVEVTVLRRVAVLGAVRAPDLYMADLTMTVRDLIARAGGLTEAGSPRAVYVVREGVRHPVPGGTISTLAAAELQSGDQVVVGERSWISRNYPTVASTAATVITLVFLIVDRAGRDDGEGQ